jgi:hypothetical protein
MFSNIQINSLQNVSWLRKWTTQFLPACILSQCGFDKRNGAKPTDLLRDLIALAFIDTPLYLLTGDGRPDRSVYYEFLAKGEHNWTKFIYLIARPLIRFFSQLTNADQKKVLIVDDSAIKRNRSKAVDFLARHYDHCEKVYYKGFRLLTLAWSDGHSLVPLEFELLTNADPEKRVGPDPEYNPDHAIAQRITNSTRKATQLFVEMVKQTLSKRIKADYLVMDSWFAHAKILFELSPLIPVVCVVKKSSKQLYKLGGRIFTAKQLYHHAVVGRKHFTTHDWGRLQCQKVHMLNGPAVKLLFITDTEHRGNWTVIASTDMNLSADEIAQIYAKRWHIEEFFKNTKQHLGMQKECESRKFTTLIAHMSIVMIRYMMLEYANRQQKDEKTIPGIFRAHKEELQALAVLTCIQIILFEVTQLLKCENPTEEINTLCQKYAQLNPAEFTFSNQLITLFLNSES